LQAAAFDEARKVLVVFGGLFADLSSGTASLNQDTWEWSPATGKWTNRTAEGAKPDARSGAAMVYDSARAKLVLFGGRAGSGFNLEDTWEWDPTTGVWSDVGTSGRVPARSQHAMVFEASTGKTLLFGGGRSDPTTADGSGVTISLSDTWEYDPATRAWTARTVAISPSGRHDSAMVWDSARNKAVLFGGIQTDILGAAGVPKQDTWEWDPTAGSWSERTAAGSKPSQRYGHAMAFDGTRKKLVLFGGWDMSSGLAKNDVWDWEPTTGAWTQRRAGDEAGMPSGRMYASMVADDARDRLIIVGGAMVTPSGGIGLDGGVYYPDAAVQADMSFMPIPSREIWELDPVTPVFANRTPPLDAPASRYYPTVAWNPLNGRTCLFGGEDMQSGSALNDYWEWDGKTWTEVATSGARPPARAYAALSFDPARNSMILYGGAGYPNPGGLQDTWELTAAGTWAELHPAGNPGGLMGHGMVADTARKKILLFGGMSMSSTGPFINPMTNKVWEWDGTKLTWTDRTPPASSNVPMGREYPALAYDEGQQKLFLYDGSAYGSRPDVFWEWDPISGGWALRETGEALDMISQPLVTYDSVRRREVLLSSTMMYPGTPRTWELDAVTLTWYVRSTTAWPTVGYGDALVFDRKRGIVVFVGGATTAPMFGAPIETWEYQVTNWGNGQGCTAATASQCASGFCVDGVCCEVAACSGVCQSCNPAGTCASVKAGTVVAGSCDAGKACDGSGSCKARNGLACSSSAECASGFCVDGLCCDSACTGACRSCNQAGRAGQCTPTLAGTDPQNECGVGEGVCKSTCDGVGGCVFPGTGLTCGNCLTCNGVGSCSAYDYYTCGFVRPIDGGPIIIRYDAPPIDVRYFPYDGGPVDVARGTGGSANVGGSLGRGGAGGSPRGTGGSLGTAGIDGGAGNIPRLDGSVTGLGGQAGTIAGLGGRVSLPGVGGGPGGRPGSGNGGSVGDAGAKASLHQSGCSCAVGGRSRSGAVLGCLGLGLALGWARRRRRGSA
jgi:hypothetical protein